MLDFFFDPIGTTLSLVPVWAWWVLGLFAVIFVIGVLWRLKDIGVLIHKIADWPGVAAVIGAILTIVYLIWPKPNSKDNILFKPEEQIPGKYPIPKAYIRSKGRRYEEGKWQTWNTHTGKWENDA